MKRLNHKKNKGFTLIELMVASAVFAVIMLVLVGALMITLNSAKSSRALRFAMDNVNFAMESMARSIRMGTNYTCVNGGTINISASPAPSDCTDGSFLAFIPQNRPEDYRVGYQVENGVLNRYDNSNNPVSIVSPDVRIEKLNFTVRGSDSSDGIQASVYIMMKGSVTVQGKPMPFSLQTMASQRNF